MSAEVPLAGSKAMLVDDDDDLREALAFALTRDGCKVTLARDGDEALEMLERGQRPDVVILDLIMPRVNGWEFRMRQKANLAIAGIPVIALSSDESPMAAAIDAVRYLRKPLDYGELRDAVVGTIRGSRLAQTERLAALGRLTAGIAHEVKNPLTTVVVALSAARDQLRALRDGADDEDTERQALATDELLESAQSGVERIQSIVRDVAVFAHPEAAERSFLDVRSVLDSTIRVIGSQLRERARIELDLQPVPPVKANPSLLGQVCLNLLLNATQALDPDRPGIVRARTAQSDDGGAMLEIADNGVGMSEEVRARLFTPFFTTKEIGAGAGLGLSICHTLVSSMQGRIEVTSALGRGTTFRVLLPPAASGSQRIPAPRPSARRRVLLVDDEIAITRVLSRALRDLDIECASSASEALTILARTDFDLVLTDVNMPGTSGLDLYAEVARRWPNKAARFAFMTGNPGTPAIMEFQERTGRAVLEKPFTPENVVELLQAACEKAGLRR